MQVHLKGSNTSRRVAMRETPAATEAAAITGTTALHTAAQAVEATAVRAVQAACPMETVLQEGVREVLRTEDNKGFIVHKQIIQLLKKK